MLLRAYRAPRVGSPVRARLHVALLSIGRFVQNVAALIAKAFAAGPLTNHEARLYSAATGFRTLQTHREIKVYFISSVDPHSDIHSIWSCDLPGRSSCCLVTWLRSLIESVCNLIPAYQMSVSLNI